MKVKIRSVCKVSLDAFFLPPRRRGRVSTHNAWKTQPFVSTENYMGSAEMVFLLTLPLPEYLYRFVITVVVVAVVYSTVLWDHNIIWTENVFIEWLRCRYDYCSFLRMYRLGVMVGVTEGDIPILALHSTVHHSPGDMIHDPRNPR